MVGGSGMYRKSVNSSKKVLKDIQGQADRKIHLMCVVVPGKKLSGVWKIPGNLFRYEPLYWGSRRLWCHFN